MAELLRKHGIAPGTYYRWKAEYGGMEVSVAKRLKALEEENRRLKRLVADQALDIQMLKDVASKKMVSSRAWRDAADHLAGDYRVSVRRACGALGLARSVYYYRESKRGDGPLREAIRALAQARRRWGYRRIALKLRERGWADNHKRIARIYQEEKLQVRRRNRKRISRGQREVLMRPTGPNRLWAMDF